MKQRILNVFAVVGLLAAQWAWLLPAPSVAFAQSGFAFTGVPSGNFVHTDGTTFQVYRTGGFWTDYFTYYHDLGYTVSGTGAAGGPEIHFTARCAPSPHFGDYTWAGCLHAFIRYVRTDGTYVDGPWSGGFTTTDVEYTFLVPAVDFVRIEIYARADDDLMIFSDVNITGLPTPTPTPTIQPNATPFPVEGACIPSSVLATPTPTRTVIAPTPFGTRTPTPTRTAGPTSTPAPSDLNELARFDSSLAPWTMNGVSPLVSWQGANGPNGGAGIAYLPFSDAPTVNVPGTLTPPNITPQGPLLVYERLGMPRQVRIVADAQVPNLPSGTYAYLQVFYWPDGGLGTTPWRLAQNIRINSVWHTVSALITVPSGEALPRAVAVRAVIGIAPIDNPLGFQPQAVSNGVQLDNLRLLAGSNANSPTASGLPVCSGTGGGTNPPVSSRICQVRRIDVDVFKCPRPESILEIGGWISWLTCNVTTYFTFVTENFDQLEAIRARNQRYQPFAAGTELITTINVIQQGISDVQAIPVANTAPVVVSSEFDGSSIDDFLANGLPPVPTYNPNADPFGDALAVCPDSIRNFSQVASAGACFAIYHLRNSQILGIFQLVFNIACYGGLFLFFWNILASPKESL